MAGCCSLPFCLCLLLFLPLSLHFMLYSHAISLYLFILLCCSPSSFPSASARRWRGMITKWLLARWLNGTVDIFPISTIQWRRQGGTHWPSPPVLCTVCSYCIVLLSSHHPTLTSEGRGCCYRPTDVGCTCTACVCTTCSPNSSNTTTWSVPLCVKIWCSKYPVASVLDMTGAACQFMLYAYCPFKINFTESLGLGNKTTWLDKDQVCGWSYLEWLSHVTSDSQETTQLKSQILPSIFAKFANETSANLHFLLITRKIHFVFSVLFFANDTSANLLVNGDIDVWLLILIEHFYVIKKIIIIQLSERCKMTALLFRKKTKKHCTIVMIVK